MKPLFNENLKQGDNIALLNINLLMFWENRFHYVDSSLMFSFLFYKQMNFSYESYFRANIKRLKYIILIRISVYLKNVKMKGLNILTLSCGTKKITVSCLISLLSLFYEDAAQDIPLF